MIALRPAQHLVALALPDFHLVLSRQFQCGFDRLRTAAGEVHGTAAKILAGKFQQFLCVFLRDGGRELAGVNELQLPPLFRHRGGDLLHAVSNKIHCGGAGKVEVAFAIGIPHVHAFAADC